MQRELHKVHSAERVMKRNLQLQIPDEVCSQSKHNYSAEM